MKPTKEVLELLRKREKYGELANSYECKVNEWCEKHGVNTYDIYLEYGCMLTTEPSTYNRLYLERIEET